MNLLLTITAGHLWDTYCIDGILLSEKCGHNSGPNCSTFFVSPKFNNCEKNQLLYTLESSKYWNYEWDGSCCSSLYGFWYHRKSYSISFIHFHYDHDHTFLKHTRLLSRSLSFVLDIFYYRFTIVFPLKIACISISYCEMLKEENVQLTQKINSIETHPTTAHQHRVNDLEQTVLTLRGMSISFKHVLMSLLTRNHCSAWFVTDVIRHMKEFHTSLFLRCRLLEG